MTKPRYRSAQPDDTYCYTAWVRYESKIPLEMLLDSPLCFVDTETTGLGHDDRIIEIALCRVERGSLDRWMTSLVDPVWAVLSPKASEVSGITRDMLAEAPLFESLAEEIAAMCSGAYMVAHNAAFDRRMLEASFGDVGMQLQPKGWVCTQQLSREHVTGLKSYSLQSLVSSLCLPQHTAHRAEGDVRTLMALWAHITRGYR